MSILLGIGLAIAGLAGAAGHLSAKETNEKAQQISQDAQTMYNSSKASLENAKKQTENGLVKLGYTKKKALDTSVTQFLRAYEKVKNIRFTESIGISEISNFNITPQEALELQQMSNVYGASFSTGAAGAATGAIVALAVSGNLGIVTSTLGIAGTMLRNCA